MGHHDLALTDYKLTAVKVHYVTVCFLRCAFTFEPHQSQNLASLWILRLHLEQDDTEDEALFATDNTCCNTRKHRVQH